MGGALGRVGKLLLAGAPKLPVKLLLLLPKRDEPAGLPAKEEVDDDREAPPPNRPVEEERKDGAKEGAPNVLLVTPARLPPAPAGGAAFQPVAVVVNCAGGVAAVVTADGLYSDVLPVRGAEALLSWPNESTVLLGTLVRRRRLSSVAVVGLRAVCAMRSVSVCECTADMRLLTSTNRLC